MKRASLAGPLVVKSLVFILVTSLATAVLALSISDTGVGETDSYRARFTDVTGLVEGDSVRIAGVRGSARSRRSASSTTGSPKCGSPWRRAAPCPPRHTPP